MTFYGCKKLIRQAGSQIKPSESWKQASREALLAEIRRSPVWREAQAREKQKTGSFSLFPFLPDYRLIFRPLGIMAIIGVVVLSGSITTVSAARSSLPGDVFYPVKIGLERAQISLALSLEKKAELEISFAGSRLKEVEEIIAKKDLSPDRQIKASAGIEQAIYHLTAGLDSVQKQLENIKKADNAQQAIGISRLVNDNALILEENLLQLKGKITKEQSKTDAQQPAQATATIEEAKKISLAVDKSLATIDQALVKIDETNSKSLSVMVEKSLILPNNEAKQEAAAKLQTTIERMERKIEVTEKKINSVTQNIEQESSFTGTASSVTAILEDSAANKPAAVVMEVINTDILKQAVKEVENKPEEAKKSIEDAKRILGEKDSSKLGDVLNKVQETNTIVQDAREKIKDAEALFKSGVKLTPEVLEESQNTIK